LLFEDKAEMITGMCMGVGGLLGLFVGPLNGRLSDRFGRKPVLIGTTCLASLPAFVMKFLKAYQSAPKFFVFMICTALAMGGSGQGGMSIMQAYISDCADADARPAALGRLVAFGFGLPSVIAPFVFGKVFEAYGPEGYTWCFFGCALVSPLWMLLVPESKSGDAVVDVCINPFQSVRIMRGPSRDKDGSQSIAGAMRCIFLLCVIATLPKMGYLISIGLYAQEQYDFTPSKVAALSTTLGASQIVVQLIIPCLLRCCSKRIAIGVGVFCGACSGLLVAIPGISGDILFLANLLMAFSFLSYTVCVDMVGEVIPSGARGEALSVLGIAMAISAGLGPAVFGIVVTSFERTSYPGGAFLTIAVFMLLGLLAVPLLPTNTALLVRRKSNSELERSLQTMGSTRSIDSSLVEHG
jgi:DHA1 family tetracycline resistance protein-like MFS transporter